MNYFMCKLKGFTKTKPKDATFTLKLAPET